jgi:hypothetical protein
MLTRLTNGRLVAPVTKRQERDVNEIAELPGDDQVLSKTELARQFDCSVRNVDRLIEAGELPIVQISPRRVGVLRSDARDYLRARRQWRPTKAGAQREPSAQSPV